MASSMIAIRYHFHGPAMPMVTACASGTNAIGEALRLIRHGYADAMVAGGAGGDRQRAGRRGLLQYAGPLPLRKIRTRLPCPSTSAVRRLRHGRKARVCSSSRSLSMPKQRGATIYAELTGYGSTCDAYHITSPIPAQQRARAIADAWRETSLDTDRVYFNAHGTGTPMNDRRDASDQKSARRRPRAGSPSAPPSP